MNLKRIMIVDYSTEEVLRGPKRGKEERNEKYSIYKSFL